MSKKYILLLPIMIIITFLTVIITLAINPLDPHNIAKAFEDTEKLKVILDGEIIELSNPPILKEDKILIPADLISEYIDESIEISEDYNRLYVKKEDTNFSTGDKSLAQWVESEVSLNFLTEEVEHVQYVNIKGLEKIFEIKIDYIPETNILIIDKFKDTVKVGRLKKDTNLRSYQSFFSKSMDELLTGDEVQILDEEDKWTRVITSNGYIGYVKNEAIDITARENNADTSLNSKRESWKNQGKINMVWDHITKYSPDLSKEEKIDGLDIISPTWFSIVSPSGYIVNNGDKKYVEDAHKKGYKVWGLITNSFDPDLTNKLLSNEQAQENVIRQLLVYSSIYNLDGINIDFENVYYEDKDSLTRFVEKLTEELRKHNLIVSMDMTVPSSSPNWSKFYDREKLGQIVDYCMVMTYDEHWAASPKSGSVASISWVASGIERTLEYIPNDKLIMGIPFYTREWEETIDDNGKINIKSKAISMETVMARIEEYNAEVIWLDDIGQYYTEYMKDGNRYRIWIEDERSVELKSNLVNKYDLAGASSWRKGFEKKEVWPVLKNIIKDNDKAINVGD